MLAVHCPRCGRPAPVSLASPDVMECAACHHRGPPPAEAARGLRAAAHIVFQADVRRRQLSDALRRTLVTASRRHARLLVVFALASVPITAFAALVLLGIWISDDSDGRLVTGGMVVAAWLGTVGAGAAVLAVVRRRQRRIEEACAARPPAAPGEPAACHVCGAPLDGGGDGVIARCGFCAADNLVAPAVLERVRARQVVIFRSFEEAVGAELAAFGRATSGAAAAVVATALVVPVAVFIIAVLAVVIADSRRLPVDAAVRYAVVSTSVGQCVGKIASMVDGGVAVRFGGFRRAELPEEQALAPGAPIDAVSPGALIGRAVTAKGGTGVVEEVFSSPLTGNSAEVRRADGTSFSSSIAGLCLEGAPTR
ncbi:hypothetical protein WMF18_42035 [Sorangium sp. So ce315]|uniref:hypothetical protein n=1 Tax=Sorangium sp. So ce315 TaxID=3133299 RepID=UPI003F5E6DA5